MSPGARKLRDFYAMKKDAPVYQREFGFYVMDKWKAQGYVKKDVTDAELAELFGYDPGGAFPLYNLGWCEAGFDPVFEVKVLEDLGDYELVQDFAGRSVKYFKGRRDGFMPEYIACPVTDQKSWEEKCLWRMDPKSQGRRKGIEWAIRDGIPAAREGKIISANLVGGYMYLRSLIGPLELLYMFYENPDLIHRCMEAWLNLADSVYAEIQKEISFDEVFLAEDICYKKGLLISPEMVREFLFPYYQQLITNIKARQLDKSRKLYFTIDTDGNCDQFIPLYSELGLDYLSPFEVAAGNDVVRTGKEYPNLLMHGGIDKRILAESKEAIDREVDRIMPVMKKRGGYIPTCDHGVPEEVPFENYLHYRKRMKEFA
ncbi:MAG: uroporphyrinogen decarboxylase family protein [Treponema sp.]|nr:uroporphyrinogen decarboxylase family protein [Treponema sp.]